MEQAATVRVPLTIEQRADKADEMARLVTLIVGIEADKAAYAKRRNDEIKEHQAELEALANVVRGGAEEKSQRELTFTQAEAARALAGVGTAACTCEGGPDAEVKAPTCSVHGVETRGENAAVDEQGAIPAGDPSAPCDGFHHVAECEHAQGSAEVTPDFVVPEVETIVPETPPVVDEFIAAQKSRRRRRAEA